MMRKTKRRLMILFGRAPDCPWVQLRLGAFYGWDPCLSKHEFRAIERHLQNCSACAEQWTNVYEIHELIEQGIAAAQPTKATPEVIAERVMAKIDAYEAERANKGLRQRIVLKRRLALALVSACVLIIALPLLAHFGNYVWKAIRPEKAEQSRTEISFQKTRPRTTPGEPSEMSAPENVRRANRAIQLEPLLGLEITRHVKEVVIGAQVEALLRNTEEKNERWARREYPHVMWLYDLLKDKFDYHGTWQGLLIGSGEILRFDYPLSLGEPNCEPRIEGIRAAAATAGFKARLSPDGEFLLPPLVWADIEGAGASLKLSLIAGEREKGPAIPKDEMPVGYIEEIANHPRLVESVLTYLTVSGQIAGTPELEDFAAKTKNLLFKLLSNDASCDFVPYGLRAALEQIFNLRKEILAAKTAVANLKQKGG
jgi:hypothetical protein